MLYTLTVLCDYGGTAWYNIITEKAESQVTQGTILLGLYCNAL